MRAKQTFLLQIKKLSARPPSLPLMLSQKPSARGPAGCKQALMSRAEGPAQGLASAGGSADWGPGTSSPRGWEWRSQEDRAARQLLPREWGWMGCSAPA